MHILHSIDYLTIFLHQIDVTDKIEKINDVIIIVR